MPSTTLTLFCTPDELAHYLRDTATRFGYRVLAFADGDAAVPVAPEAFEALPSQVRRVFLVPSSPPRRWSDLGDVAPGRHTPVGVRAGRDVVTACRVGSAYLVI